MRFHIKSSSYHHYAFTMPIMPVLRLAYYACTMSTMPIYNYRFKLLVKFIETIYQNILPAMCNGGS